jgi:hypothetical protein
LVALSGRQHTELIAIGICHHHPADIALADVDSSRPEGEETVDFRWLITVDVADSQPSTGHIVSAH